MKEKIKKLFIVSLAVLMMMTSIPMAGFVGLDLGFTAEAAFATSGKCGENVTWKYDEKTKTLTVSGTGDMYDYDMHQPLYMADPDTDIEKVVIENGVTKIGAYAFMCKTVKSISIADTVTVIGESTFSYTSVTSINLPKSLKVIKDYAFYGCDKLKKVTLPDSVQKVGDYAFSACESLTYFNTGNGSVKLNSRVLEDTAKLQKVVIGKNAEFAEDGYMYCSNDTAVFSVHKSNPYLSSDENGVLYNKDKTVLLAYPSLSKAESFTVPKTVKKIERYAFSDAANLKTVKMTLVEEIDDYAFQGSGVKTVSLGSKLKKMSYDPFLFCEKLTALILPASLTEFDEFSFGNTIRYTADKNSKALSSENGNLFNKDKTILYTYCNGSKETSYKVPDTVETIEDFAFDGAVKLKSVTLPSKLRIIGENAFYNCAITSITIPKSVELIGDSAFDSSKLKKLVIEDGCEAVIGNWAFYCCENLNDITIPTTVTKVGNGAFEAIGYINKLEEEGYEGPVYLGHILCYYLGYSAPLSLSIKEGTTTVCNGVIPDGTLSVKIPASVKYISDEAFCDAYSVSGINVDKKNENFVYENNTLMTKDKTRIIRYVNSILKTSYTVPDTVKAIDYNAFNTATSLSEIDFGKCELESIIFDTFAETKWYSSLPADEFVYINNVAVGSTHSYSYVPVVMVKDGTTAIRESFLDTVLSEAMVIPESVNYVGVITDNVYYMGTEEQWNSIEKSEYVKESEESHSNIIFNFHKNNHEHIFYESIITNNTCLAEGEALYACPCGESYKKTTPKVHHYSTYYTYEKAATFKSKGKKTLYCDMCYKKLVSKTTAPIASIQLEKTKYTYTGEFIEPEVIVKDTEGNVLEHCSYYDNLTDSTKVGTHKITVYLDDYVASGTKELSFDILPGKTSKITATQSESAVKLTWNKVTGATGYRIYQYNTKTKKYEKLGDTTKNSYIVKKLKSGTTYKFAVKAYTKVGKKVYWASSYTAITTATEPSAPVVKTRAGSKKVSLSWEKVRGASGYIVYIMNSKGKYERQAVTKELKYVQTGLTKGKTYSFRVRAYKKVGGTTLYGSYNTYTVKAK